MQLSDQSIVNKNTSLKIIAYIQKKWAMNIFLSKGVVMLPWSHG